MASPLCPSWRSATVRRLADPAQPGITTKDWTMEAPARRSERKSDGLIISVRVSRQVESFFFTHSAQPDS